MKGITVLKRSLSLVLTVVMLFSCWVFTAPSASAATAGKYWVKVVFDDSKNSASVGSSECTLYYKSNNGTGQESSMVIDNSSAGGMFGDWKGFTWEQQIDGYPSGVSGWVNIWYWTGKIEFTLTISVWDYNTSTYKEVFNSGNTTLQNSGQKNYGRWNVTNGTPYANKITDVGGSLSSMNVPTDNKESTATTAFTLGTVKDQYGVNWYDDPSLSVVDWDGNAFSDAYISNKKLVVKPSANRSNHYSIRIKETCGSVSNTNKTVELKVFDYKVTFYDENGTTVLKDEQTIDYGGTATAPSSPTKASTATQHFTFNTWTGDSYQNITSGAQTKTVKASYTAAKHNFGAPSIEFATNGQSATAKRTCSNCGYVDKKKATVTSEVKTAATCTTVGTTRYTATAKFTKVNTETVLEVTATKDVDDIPIVSKAHNWTNTKKYVRTPAKCGEDATYWKECSHNTNHKAETLDTTQYWTDEHTAKAHDYGDPTKLTVDETYREENYAAASYHKQICGRDTLCNDGADCNGEYPVKYTEHTMSPWAYTLPTDDGSRVIGIVLEQLADFDGESKCYSYCIYCGYTKTQPHHDWQVVEDETVTYDATCTTAGQTTSACRDCGKTKIETIPALGHNPELKQNTAPDDLTAGKCYYQCTRCDKYFAAFDDGTKYYPDDTAQDTLQKALDVEGSANIPFPQFNSYVDPDISDGNGNQYDYSFRGASLKLTKEKEDGLNTIQKIRFSGSVAVPANMDNEIKYSNYDHYIKGELDQITDDDCILDFGFVYTQMHVIAKDTKANPYVPDLSKLVINNDDTAKISKMSVPSKNSGAAPLNIKAESSTWAGVTPHQVSDSTFLTFNLLINVKEKNWLRIYAARTYITYKYHGKIYTVYDAVKNNETISARAVWYVATETLERYDGVEDPFIEKMCQFLKENITEKKTGIGDYASIEEFIESEGNGSDWWKYC